MSDAARLPEGSPRHAAFDGIVEGRVGDAATLRAADAQLRSLGIVGGHLEVDGGRFTWLPDDDRLPGDRLSPARQRELLAALNVLIAAAGEPTQVESTLRCTMTWNDQVVETLFTVQRGSVRPVSRVRAATDADRVPALPAAHRRFGKLGAGRFALVTALLAAILAVASWQAGLFGQLLGSSPSDLVVHTGPFGDALDVELGSSWGRYEVRIVRGPAYPTTAADVARRLAAAETTADSAAVNVLAGGGVIWVQLRDVDGEWMAAASCSLRSLLEGGAARAELPCRIGARDVVLALGHGGSGR